MIDFYPSYHSKQQLVCHGLLVFQKATNLVSRPCVLGFQTGTSPLNLRNLQQALGVTNAHANTSFSVALHLRFQLLSQGLVMSQQVERLAIAGIPQQSPQSLLLMLGLVRES